MRTRRTVVLLVPGAALAAAAIYVLVYLARWEWHRALVAASFMIALEIGIGFALVLDRLKAMEDRMSSAEREANEATMQAISENRPEPAEPFGWLSDASNRMSVFIPILLGAGVVLSALAWAVERLARVTAGPTLERRLVLRLQPLTLPAGTLRGGAPRVLPALPHLSRPRSWRWLLLVAGIVPALLLGKAIDGLADATQNRPDRIVATDISRVELEVHNRQAPGVPLTTVNSLWGACQNQIGNTHKLVGVEHLGGDRVALRVQPAIGKYAERRMRGCLQDATTDLIRADVISLQRVPGP